MDLEAPAMKTGTLLLLVGIGALVLLAQYFVEKDIAAAGAQAQNAAASVGSGITLKGLIGV